MESLSEGVADELNTWFEGVVRLADDSLFSIAPKGPHRDAVLLDVLKRNARIITESEVDPQGRLYTPLCLFLAAAVRRLGTSLRVGHWQAALENVLQLQQQLARTSIESANLGIEIGPPSAVFKHEFDEAVKQTGLVGVAYLRKENRDVALGLSVNWGVRFLIAYALQSSPSRPKENRRDLVWISKLVSPLAAHSRG